MTNPIGNNVLFPNVLPDETAYSLLCRFYLVSGHSSFRNYTLPLLNLKGSRPTNEFPCFLPTISQLSGVNLETLIKDVTTLHYYEPFLSMEDYIYAYNSLKTGNTTNIQTKLGMVANRITSGRELKYCPVCAESDLVDFGTTYWHRIHQLVGVTTCPLHHCELQEIRKVSSTPRLPSSGISKKDCITEECEISDLIADEFSDYSFRYLKSNFKQSYINQLRRLGLLTECGRIRQQKLKDLLMDKLALVSHHSTIFQYLLHQTKDDCYPECLFYCPNARHQPIKHLFLIYVLFGSWSKFKDHITLDEMSSQKVPQQAQIATRTENEWDEALNMLRNGASLRSTAPQFCTTVSTLKIRAQMAGVRIDTRPSKIFHTEERAIWRKLFVAKKTQEIAAEFNVSVGAIEKILTRHPRIKALRKRVWYFADFSHYKSQILNHLKSYPLATRNQIKGSVSAAYSWLYKHEKQWLYANLPPEIPRKNRFVRPSKER